MDVLLKDYLHPVSGKPVKGLDRAYRKTDGQEFIIKNIWEAQGFELQMMTDDPNRDPNNRGSFFLQPNVFFKEYEPRPIPKTDIPTPNNKTSESAKLLQDMVKTWNHRVGVATKDYGTEFFTRSLDINVISNKSGDMYWVIVEVKANLMLIYKQEYRHKDEYIALERCCSYILMDMCLSGINKNLEMWKSGRMSWQDGMLVYKAEDKTEKTIGSFDGKPITLTSDGMEILKDILFIKDGERNAKV